MSDPDEPEPYNPEPDDHDPGYSEEDDAAMRLSAEGLSADESVDREAEVEESPPFDPGYSADYAAAMRLSAARLSAQERVDLEAEATRALYLTTGSGQALEYQRTSEEARLADAAPDPLTPEDWPMLNAERLAVIAAGGSMTMREAVALVLDLDARWMAAGAEIKRLRRLSKLTIAAAEDVESIDAVFPINWPRPQWD